MAKINKLFLLDGMALIYRAHFALIRSPIYHRDGRNTSAVHGFANSLLDIIRKHKPTHIAVATDTSDPTFRHEMYPPYKAQRDAMPEDIQQAIPEVYKLVEAFNIPLLRYPGYEADDVIGTFARLAEEEGGFETYMVTPDKDFAQLVSPSTFQYKPARQGSGAEILDVEKICEKWNVDRPEQVIDILGLWGDASDNIPGVPGVGEKTAMKMIAQYGSVENMLAHADADLKGKQREKVLANHDQALLSKELATINRHVPITQIFTDLELEEPDEDALKDLFRELEFSSIAKRMFGESYKEERIKVKVAGHQRAPGTASVQGELFDFELNSLPNTKHRYTLVDSATALKKLVGDMNGQKAVCFDVETTGLDTRVCELVGLSFSWEKAKGFFVPCPADRQATVTILETLRPFFENPTIEKVGHNLKFDCSVLWWYGFSVSGPMFDTSIAHFLIDPESRHTMDAVAETYLNYTPVPIDVLIGSKKSPQKSMREVPMDQLVDYAVEDADITMQLKSIMEKLLKEKGQEKVFYEVEMPLVHVLCRMEAEGVTIDPKVLKDFSVTLGAEIEKLSIVIEELAGESFNLNSPKQLGEILFGKLKLVEKPKKTATGQYATNEQVLQGLAPHHKIVARILEFREASKLKSTYVDALPESIFEGTGRIHTHFTQTGAATGRLASNNPNLQNIPIRTELGQEIRRAFVARGPDFQFVSADYSQIELRVMASMSGDPGMCEAFEKGLDVHASTAAKVFGVSLEDVSSDMRRKAKMVNFGIIYGISAFGLSQRLGIPRKEGASLIENYFAQYPKVKTFMEQTVAYCREHGYVETLTGRRRYLRDINSRNAPTRNAAERTAINSPIQGTAADMIKLAMTAAQHEIESKGLRSRMLLQVHDELIFDQHREEADELRALINDSMKNAIKLDIPIEIEIGVGANWLEAH